MENNPARGKRYKIVSSAHTSVARAMHRYLGETGVITDSNVVEKEFCTLTFDDPGAQQDSVSDDMRWWWHKSDLEEVK